MNLNIFITAVKKIPSKLKEITRLPGFKRYIILALILTVLFTVFTFPFEIIVMKQLKKLEGKEFKNITVKQMDISLLGKSYAETLAITFMNDDSVLINNLKADISFISLIRKKIRATILADRVFYSSDKLKIECSINPNEKSTSSSKNQSADKHAINLNLELKIDESWTTPKSKIIKPRAAPSDGTIKARINNIEITADAALFSGFQLPQPTKISSINIDSSLANRLFTIKNFTASGKDIRGRITGNVTLEPFLAAFDNSKLNLKISAEPDSLVFGGIPMPKIFTDASGKPTLLLTGTIAKPKSQLGDPYNRGTSEIPPFETDPEK
ncbi:MAG: type II secretion system protein GspN [Leptospirales bacterium]|nr:type II secretion system protein GspN [Leptospirales bacterium]